MVTKEQFAEVFNRKFKDRNEGREMPDAWMSWAYAAFKMGYDKGQQDFMKNHDWYE